MYGTFQNDLHSSKVAFCLVKGMLANLSKITALCMSNWLVIMLMWKLCMTLKKAENGLNSVLRRNSFDSDVQAKNRQYSMECGVRSHSIWFENSFLFHHSI